MHTTGSWLMLNAHLMSNVELVSHARGVLSKHSIGFAALARARVCRGPVQVGCRFVCMRDALRRVLPLQNNISTHISLNHELTH